MTYNFSNTKLQNLNMLINKNKMIKKYFTIILLVIVFSLFLPVYILSFLKVINFWSFSQSNIDYFFGIIRRGLFGEFLNFFENFGIQKKKAFATIFIIINSLNILFFFQIVKKYIRNPILQLILVFHPALILFSFNDLGAYQRHEQFGILIILFNYFILNYLNRIKKLYYFFYFLILTNIFIFLSILIHEINFFFIGFHFLMTLKFFKLRSKEVIINSIFVIFQIFIVFLLVKINLDNDQIEFFRNIYNKQNLWFDGVVHFAVKTDFAADRFISNLLIFDNLLINLTLILYSLFLLTWLFLDKENYNKSTFLINILFAYNFVLIIIGLTIGDFGRWLHFICISNIVIFALFDNKEIKMKFKFNTLNKCLIFLVLFISLFIVKIPHTEMYKEKNISIFKGYYFKIFSIIKSISSNSNSDFYDLNKRFKN